MHRFLTVTRMLAVSLLAIPAGAQADPGEIQKTFQSIPAEYEATIQTSNCMAAPGPQISIEGDQTLSGLQADMILTKPIGTPSPQDRVVVE